MGFCAAGSSFRVRDGVTFLTPEFPLLPEPFHDFLNQDTIFGYPQKTWSGRLSYVDGLTCIGCGASTDLETESPSEIFDWVYKHLPIMNFSGTFGSNVSINRKPTPFSLKTTPPSMFNNPQFDWESFVKLGSRPSPYGELSQSESLRFSRLDPSAGWAEWDTKCRKDLFPIDLGYEGLPEPTRSHFQTLEGRIRWIFQVGMVDLYRARVHAVLGWGLARSPIRAMFEALLRGFVPYWPSALAPFRVFRTP